MLKQFIKQRFLVCLLVICIRRKVSLHITFIHIQVAFGKKRFQHSKLALLHEIKGEKQVYMACYHFHHLL